MTVTAAYFCIRNTVFPSCTLFLLFLMKFSLIKKKEERNTVFPFSSLHKMASEDLAISRLVFHLIANNIFIDLEEQDGKEKKGKEWFYLLLGKNTFWMKSKTSQWRNPFCHIWILMRITRSVSNSFPYHNILYSFNFLINYSFALIIMYR